MLNLYIRINHKFSRRYKLWKIALCNKKIFLNHFKRQPLNNSKWKKLDLDHYQNKGHICMTFYVDMGFFACFQSMVRVFFVRLQKRYFKSMLNFKMEKKAFCYIEKCSVRLQFHKKNENSEECVLSERWRRREKISNSDFPNPLFQRFTFLYLTRANR